MTKIEHAKKIIADLNKSINKDSLISSMGDSKAQEFISDIKILEVESFKDLLDIDIFRYPKRLAAYFYPSGTYFRAALYWIDADEKIFAFYKLTYRNDIEKTFPVEREPVK
jgi:hypothetical protein